MTFMSCPADALHPWVIWLYYLNPLNYAFRAVVVSEFSAPHWDHPAPHDPSVRAGTAVLQANGLNLPTAWMWGSVLILLGYIFVINVAVVVSLKLLNGEPHPLHSLPGAPPPLSPLSVVNTPEHTGCLALSYCDPSLNCRELGAVIIHSALAWSGVLSTLWSACEISCDADSRSGMLRQQHGICAHYMLVHTITPCPA